MLRTSREPGLWVCLMVLEFHVMLGETNLHKLGVKFDVRTM
jgi:hypothetical protein